MKHIKDAVCHLDRVIESDVLKHDLAHLKAGGHCEACGVNLQPVPWRCERHVNTEPGDPEWTMDEEPSR